METCFFHVITKECSLLTEITRNLQAVAEILFSTYSHFPEVANISFYADKAIGILGLEVYQRYVTLHLNNNSDIDIITNQDRNGNLLGISISKGDYQIVYFTVSNSSPLWKINFITPDEIMHIGDDFETFIEILSEVYRVLGL